MPDQAELVTRGTVVALRWDPAYQHAVATVRVAGADGSEVALRLAPAEVPAFPIGAEVELRLRPAPARGDDVRVLSEAAPLTQGEGAP